MLGRYSHNRKKILDTLLVGAWCIMVVGVYTFVPNLVWATFIVVGVTAAGIYTEMQLAARPNRNNYTTGKVIPVEDGFILQRKASKKYIYWKELKHFEWVGTWVCFEMQDGSCVCVKKQLHGMKALLPHIPKYKGAKKEDRQLLQLAIDEGREETFAGKLCEICGFYAVEDARGRVEGAEEACMHCLNEPWNSKFHESQKDYVRTKALAHFKIYTEYEPVNFHPKEKEYKQSPSWIPPVTEAEVKIYSAKMYGLRLYERPEIKATQAVDSSRCLPCMVCGFFALPHPDDAAYEQDKTCRICGCEEWNVSLGNEVDYLCQNQLEHFAVLNPKDRVEFYPADEEEFKPIAHWKPRVTEQEVLDYSKKQYWNE